jgi:integrase
MNPIPDTDTRITARLELDERGKTPRWRVKLRTPDGPQTITLDGPAHVGRGRPPHGAVTRKMALDSMEAIRVKARDGLLERGAKRPARNGEPSLTDLVDGFLTYLEVERDRRPGTLTDYRNTLRHRVLDQLGADTAAKSITTDDIERLRRYLLAEVSRRTAQKTLTIVCGMFGWATKQRLISSNPTVGAERVQVTPKAEFAVLTAAEVLHVARKADSEQLTAAIIVAGFTGLRQGEVRGLRWRDVDFAGELIHVRRNVDQRTATEGPTKGKSARSVPMTTHVAKALEDLSRRDEHTGRNDYVFTLDGGFVGDRWLRDGLYDAMKKAKVDRDRDHAKPFTFHDLRHTFGTIAVQAFPVPTVQAWMGHADITTTMRYVHHVPQTDAAAKLSKLMEVELGAGDPVAA